MKIPIRNIYYLLCYAWDSLDEAEVVAVEAGDYEQLVNLFGRVLAGGLEHVLKRGLDQGYVERQEVLAGVRGRIDFASSLKGCLFQRGRAACVFEDLTHDVMHNRILRATARNLLRCEELEREPRRQLHECVQRMNDVSDLRVNTAAFRKVQLHSNNGFYRFLLHVCRLIHDQTVIDEGSGRIRFQDFTRDDRQMARLFESFLRNFYARETPQYRVSGEKIDWLQTDGSPEDMAFLPSMRTDISLESRTRKIVVDAKFYRDATSTFWEKERLHASNLYQMFAYLKNLECQGGLNLAAEGILIYPLVGKPLNLRYTVHGHPLRVITVDLGQDWRNIRDFLLSLV